jgi:two-component system, response regulator PdtaR
MSEPLRVLVVEDEAPILLQLEALIEDQGHQVVATAMSSSEAITKLHETEPDLVLLDLQLLDGETGTKVARYVRDTGDTRVLFMTANASRLGADLDGAIGVLAKPCSRAALIATVRYLAECLKSPPPVSARPMELVMSAAFERSIQATAPRA